MISQVRWQRRQHDGQGAAENRETPQQVDQHGRTYEQLHVDAELVRVRETLEQR